jgi:hypothetical protein
MTYDNILDTVALGIGWFLITICIEMALVYVFIQKDTYTKLVHTVETTVVYASVIGYTLLALNAIVGLFLTT